MKLLLFTLSFGLGEGLCACHPQATAIWPLFAILAVLALLFGYGLSVRGWPFLVAFLSGCALFWQAAGPGEQLLREKPWERYRHGRSQSLPESDVRQCLARRATIGLKDRREAAALNKAILLGERTCLSPEAKRSFLASGTIHVFAISGLHVMIIAQTLAVLLALMLVPRRLAGLAAVPLLWGYVLMTGNQPSAIRAALMATSYFSAPAFWRRPDALRAWCFAFLIVQTVDPLKIRHVGSLLSFTVMLALVIGARCARKLPTKLAQTLFLSLVAWAAGTPIAAMSFGRVTPGGYFANLILVPAAGCTVSAGALGVLASFLSHKAAFYLNNLAALGTDVMVAVARIVARLPYANFEHVSWSLSGCLAWYAALAALMWSVYRATRPRPL